MARFERYCSSGHPQSKYRVMRTAKNRPGGVKWACLACERNRHYRHKHPDQPLPHPVVTVELLEEPKESLVTRYLRQHKEADE